MASAACCTCASLLSLQGDAYGTTSEKPIRHRSLPCCGRQICMLCIEKTPRFEKYCPFCQTTRLPLSSQEEKQSQSTSAIPKEAPPAYSTLSPIPRHTPPPAPRPRHATLSFSSTSRPASPTHLPLPPPAYTPDNDTTAAGSASFTSSTPAYSTITTSTSAIEDDESEADTSPAVDVTHYLHGEDTFASIALAYGVPVHVLKSHNGIHADHLLSARRHIAIPAAYYRGPSLSPHPLEDPIEAARKAKIRKLMVNCKVSEYRVAVMYLEEAYWDLDRAEEKVHLDDAWERENPVATRGVGTAIVAGPSSRRGLRLAEPLSPARIARLLS